MSIDISAVTSRTDSTATSPTITGPPRRSAFVHRPFEVTRRRATRADRIVASRSIWLAPILALQTVLAFRLSNSLSDGESLAINSGHQLISQLLHGAPTPSFGQYVDGVPSLYAVPAALLDSAGGAQAVLAASTLLMLAATVFVYLATRRLFGQAAALLASGVFALAPQTLFTARFVSPDAPAVLMLAAALYVAASPHHRQRTQVLGGVLLGLAAGDHYFALLFVPGVLAVAFNTARPFGTPRAWAQVAATVGAALLTMSAIALLTAGSDQHGWQSTVLGGHAVQAIGRVALAHQAVAAIGALAFIGALAPVLSRSDRAATTVLWAAAVAPVALEVGYGESASIQRNAVFSLVFLAPVVGVVARWLVGRGPFLALRAPAALVGTMLLLSTGMSTSSAMMHSWPSSRAITSVLRSYVHAGGSKYLVDGSQVPAYYLSGSTGYGQWVSTLDNRFAGRAGTAQLKRDLQDARYRLVLYRTDGTTPALDASMRTTLRTRYTLVAQVPVSPDDAHANWSLWLAELPR